MTSAYILVKTTPGHEREVYYKFFYVPEVCEAHPLVGEYSLILKIKADTCEGLGHIATDKIGSISNIVSTEVLPVLETDSKTQRLEAPLNNIL